MQITIAGTPGSGKSTAGKILAKKLGIPHFSTGDFFRKMAADRGLSVADFSEIARSDGGAIDRALDDENRRLAAEIPEFVLDARLGWFFIPGSFKILLTCPLAVAAERMAGDARPGEDAPTAASLAARLAAENARYAELYGIVDQHDPAHFDAVFSSEKMSPDAIVAEISQKIRG